jgi:PAS domain S-box-containing protein
LPGDLPFLKRRMAALVRRRALFDWHTSVDSELRLLHAITLAVSESESFSAAIQVVLRMICDATGWILGQAWIRKMDASGLQCSPEWHTEAAGLEGFRAATETTTFELGVGLPGEVWASQQRAWVDDVSVDGRFVRSEAARAVGLKAGFFVPIIADGQVMAVLEFFVFEKRREDEQLLDLVSGLAMQLGSIIERKRLEEAYRLLSTAVEQMGETILITSAEEGPSPACSSWPAIIFANSAVTAITGYSPAEMVGRSPRRLFGDRADELILPRFAEVMVRGRISQGETVSRRKDGTEFDLDWRIAPVRDASGRIRYLIANLRDITDRMRVERSRAKLERALNKAAVEWRHTFDTIEWPIFILDEGGRIRRLNRAAQEVSGRSFEENLGTLIDTVGSGEPWRRACQVVSSLLGGTSIEVLQDDPVTGRTWQIGARRFRAQEGGEDQEPLILLIARDISPTIRLQDSLRRSQTMASMGALVAGVAHEVRNPLFGISATLDAFEARFGSQQEYRAYTTVLRGEVDRLNELMGELLEYGRKPSQQRSTGQIAEVIASALAACKRLAEPNQVRLVSDTPGPELPTMRMDFGRMVQVFRNLIENAIQHSPCGGVVTVRTAVEAEGAGKVLRATVEDSGPGFRNEDLVRIFEPFFTKRRGGTGLGLSIVQKILEQHGGAAVAGNRPEGGAAVTIRLPLPGPETGEFLVDSGARREPDSNRAA